MAITTGAFLNAVGILLGSIFGLAWQTPLTLRTQLLVRNTIGLANFLLGVRLMYLSIGGTFLSCLKQIFIAMIAVVLGFWVGKLLRFQRMSNYLGHLAGNAIVAAQKTPGQNPGDGFNACAILFCAAPLGLIGAVTDGLSGYFYLLAVKAVMDAMAMTGFVRLFRWPSALSAIPVFVFFSAISMAVQIFVVPHLSSSGLNSVNSAAGLLACIVTIVIFEVRKVPLANYLPALAIAPLLAKLFN
jgi:uncharacterized protein